MPEVDLEDLMVDVEDELDEDFTDEGEDAGPDVAAEEVDSEEFAPDDDAGELAEEGAEDEEDDDPVEDQDEEPEGEPEEPVVQDDPRDKEIADLKASLQTQSTQFKQLMAHLEGAKKPERPRGPDPQLREALTVFYGGGDPEESKAALAKISPHVRQEAVEMVRAAEKKRVEHMLNPGSAYGEMAGFVEDHILQVMGPYIQAAKQANLGEVLKRHSGVLKTQADKDAVADIMDDIRKGGVENELRLATELYSARQGRSEVKKQKQRLTGREKDLRAKRDARRGTRRRPKKGRKKSPELGNDWNLSKLAKQIEEDGVDMQELKDMGLL